MRTIRAIGAYILLVGLYGFAWLTAVVVSWIPRRRWKPTGRIMVTGTFHNPNWYLSHLTPLVRSGLKEVILVLDEPQLPLEGVTFVYWPRWASTLLSRPGARAIWVILAGIRYRPDLYMGYHLGPGSCTALMAGKLLGRPTCYQMTGGPVEIIGGGINAAEGIGASLRRPSRTIEGMALAVVKLFDLVVVRGSKAKAFLAQHGIARSVAVITGSVPSQRPASNGRRDIHLIFVGRLSPIKQVDRFVAIVGATKRMMPDVRAAIIGDGPLRMDLQAQASRLGLSENIEFLGQRKDVGSLLARAKVFVLTSKSEGLSIAMAEAMSAGAVPVVANIGELGDLVVEGVNGYLIEPDNTTEYASKAVSLLQDEALWTRCSRIAMQAARERCALEAVSAKWRQHLQDTIRQAPGCRMGNGSS